MNEKQGFALWLTGIPASGKSSITRELVKKMKAQNVSVIVLESDVMRSILTPEPTYSAGERDRFYRELALIGDMLTRQGMNIIYDATANRQEYRDEARRRIKRFIEVFVKCPLEVCAKRDPKGIYAQALSKKASTVPGFQSAYEPPLSPEVTLDCQAPPETGAEIVLLKLRELRYV